MENIYHFEFMRLKNWTTFNPLGYFFIDIQIIRILNFFILALESFQHDLSNSSVHLLSLIWNQPFLQEALVL